MNEIQERFLSESVHFLRDVYLPRLERSLQMLPDGDVWARPHANVLSIGTILLHLDGNIRQWILSGLGGAEDERDRDAEFAAVDGADGRTLLRRLKSTVLEACALIESLSAESLTAQLRIRGSARTGLYTVYHVVEHFAYHTGQAVWIAKSRAGA